MSQIGREICEALGVDLKGVTGLDIQIRPFRPAVVTVTRAVLDGERSEVADVLKRYILVEADPE